MESRQFSGKLFVELSRRKNEDALESSDLSNDENELDSEVAEHRPKQWPSTNSR